MTPRRAFRLPSTRRLLDAELDAELRFHIEGRVDELMTRDGLSRPAAEAEARRRFGDLDDYRRQTSAIDQHTHTRRRLMELVDDLRREARTAARALLRAPAFSLIALVTLALGLGATTAIFTLLDRVAIRPLPYATADRLLHVGTAWPGIKPDEEYGVSRYMYFRFKETSRTLADIGLYQSDVYALPGGNGLDAERVLGADASVSLFHVLGIQPIRGHLFTEDDERAREPGVMLISEGLWTRRFGSDPAVVGRVIDVGGRSMQVIGILPSSAKLPDMRAEIWEPMHLDPAAAPQNHHTFRAIARLRPGVTPLQANTELRAIMQRIIADYPNVYSAGFIEKTGFSLVSRTLRDEVVGPRAARVLWILFASVAIVLLIAAANVANLFLVRIESRRREVAVRTALGAGRWQLGAHFLAESLLLTLAAALGAIALAWGLLRVVLQFAPTSLPRLEEVQLDWRSAAFCIGVAALTGALFGVLPMLQGRIDISMLRDGGRGLTSSRGRHAARRALVVSQVALAVVLLAAAGLMIRSFQRLSAVKPGFDPVGVLAMDITLRGDRYRSDAQLVAFWHALSRRVAALPGVVNTGAAGSLPLTGEAGCTSVRADESTLDPSQRTLCVPTITVVPGYFATLGIPVRGREPGWSDAETGSGAMVVSRALAQRLWPGEDALGKTLVYSARRPLRFRVAGIAADVRANGLQKPPIEAAYFPIASPADAGPSPRADMDANYLRFVVRSTGDLRQLSSAIQHVMTEIDRQVPVADVEPMEVIVARSVAQISFTMLLLGISGAIAMVLSAVGIYGVISYLVAQRRGEIGIRMALGAQLSRIGGMVVLQSVRMAAVGALVGLVAALAGTRLLGGLLFEVSPTDPLVLLLVPVVLVAIAALASYAPARRAARTDPVDAIRTT